MATFLNHAAIAAPRNGTTTHTVTPSAGTLVAGTLFTPTAGRFLLCVVEGAVTSTTPASWTLPTNGSAVSGSGLYVWYRASAAGSDSITTTHNGSNYPVVFDFYEFSAGTTFVSSVTTNVTSITRTAANPNLTGLTVPNFVMAAKAAASAISAVSAAWNLSTTEALDTAVDASGTDGYFLSVAYFEAYASTSFQPTCTVTTSGPSSFEALTWAVKISAGGGTSYTLTATGTGTSTGTLAAAAAVPLTATGTGSSTGTLAVAADRVISATGTETTTGSLAVAVFTPSVTYSLTATGTATTIGTLAAAANRVISATGTETSTGTLAVTITSGPASLALASTGYGTTGGHLAVTGTGTPSGGTLIRGASPGGYQPRNTPAERRAFFDHKRQLAKLQARIEALEP